MGIFGYTKLANDAMIYGGFSIPQVFAFKAIELSEKTDIIRYRHYYLTGGYIIPFNSEGSTMEISTWTKFVPNTNPNVDLNVRFNYENMFQLGLGVNTNKSVALEASYTLGSTNDYEVAGLWRIGYCYNMNLSPIANYMGSSHEVHLSVAFGGN